MGGSPGGLNETPGSSNEAPESSNLIVFMTISTILATSGKKNTINVEEAIGTHLCL